MPRLTRLIACSTLCLLFSLAAGHFRPSLADDAQKPAPGEPTEAPTTDSDEGVEAIEGTRPSEDAANKNGDQDDPAADQITPLREELAQLRQELTARLTQLETRLDAQITRIDGLQQPTVAGNPDKAAAGAETELAEVKSDLKQLRTDYELLLATIEGHAKAIGEQATATAKQNESLKAHDEQLADANEKLSAVQEGQQQLDQRLLAASSGEEGTPILGNMQTNPNARGELFRAARYRLRIRNTTGQEHPLFVNGVQWTIRADEWTYIPIPLGPVALRRPGADPIDVAEDHVQWKSDNRGFYVDYDLNLNQVSVAAEE